MSDNGDRASVWDDAKVLEVMVRIVQNSVNILNATGLRP